MSPSCLSTLTYSLGLSATTGKGGSKIMWNEFYKMLLVMSGAGCAAQIRILLERLTVKYPTSLDLVADLLNAIVATV